MLDARAFVAELGVRGYAFSSGVPCSLLGAFLQEMEHQQALEHVHAANEGDALAMANGATLGGKQSFVYLQNSGLGNLMNPLTSLTEMYKIPVLLLVSWRGNPARTKPDAPEHVLMGEKMRAFLDVFGIPHKVLPADDPGAHAMLAEMTALMRARRSAVALIVPEGLLAAEHATEARPGFTRREAIAEILAQSTADDLFVATTGFTARDLAAVRHARGEGSGRDFPMIGSMGCAAPLALGLARASGKRVIVLDGDGALLMRMGALSTIGAIRPDNLLHVVFDNAAYESTGGQPTTSPTTDFAAAARACGYPAATTVADAAALAQALREGSGLRMIVCTVPGSPADAAPRIETAPPDIADDIRRSAGAPTL